MKVFGVVGWKNAGKTGLMERLVKEIVSRGFTVSTVKHAHHSFDVDHPGKDSHRHRLAGATEVMLSSRKRWALMHENRGQVEASLDHLRDKLEPVDLVLIEGYKGGSHPKVEAHRAVTKNPLIATEDATVLAVASDTEVSAGVRPVFDLDDTATIADFILQQVGLGHRPAPAPASNDANAPLTNDCFALPPGVDWVPVDTALDTLRQSLAPVVGTQDRPASDAAGWVLAQDVLANRANPPGANSAVDGYGFTTEKRIAAGTSLTLVDGRAAAGSPFAGRVPDGAAVRILTGALLPQGVNTVVLQEDVTVSNGAITMKGGLKPAANTRKAGEDVRTGDIAVQAGRRIQPQDIALMAATGCTDVRVFDKLRVGVFSTGDEIVEPTHVAAPDKTFDANRPMLLSLFQNWGYQAVDLGHVPDNRDKLKSHFDQAVKKVDVIFTSGGASAGDEDHVSALLTEAGTVSNWRIAIKPGRPLVLGLWDGTPVFGLPGNPVAAFVCSLIFGRPALSVLAGAGWVRPQGFIVPAAFEKNKKPGRREYLRARMTPEGTVEAFQSEGSGRISGLGWADGLVELGDDAQTIHAGTPVRYYPYSSFGL